MKYTIARFIILKSFGRWTLYVAAAYNYQATIRKEDPGILNFIYATQQKGEKKTAQEK